MSHFEYKCCIDICLIIKHYTGKSTIIMQDTVQYCQSTWTTFILTPISTKHYTFVSHTHFCPYACPASSPYLMSLKYLWWGQIKGTVYWQKWQAKEELLEQIMECADCVRENNEIIRKAINFLWDKKSCAFRKSDIILNTNQGKLLNTDIHWYCLIKKDVLLH